ncbi:uncharacterized protein [Periplaneta americana]|uniref:uncharacterized protein isoform X4 n=1 Tax=Periplaneta americana TaxID=6978 RepID=UPI0037E85695
MAALENNHEDMICFVQSPQNTSKNVINEPTNEFRENSASSAYGHINGIKVGTQWETRAECSAAGVHVPLEDGIHEGPDGAYSLVLCNDFKSELDCGESFTFTCGTLQSVKGKKNGAQAIGMVDPVIEYETPAQHKYKLALARSFNIGKPIRVIRGSDLTSLYAPKFGYRYDGLYIVKKYWKRIDDCSVCKYALKRCDDQPSPPWSTECIKSVLFRLKIRQLEIPVPIMCSWIM